MRKSLLLLLAALLLFTVAPSAFAASSGFSDVPRNHWAYEAITAMAEKGVIVGDKGKFRPNDRITRAEFAKIMIAAAGIDINSDNNLKQTFSDVPRNHWAFKYVEYAKSYLTGYKSAYGYTYKPNEFAVREDIAVALVRLLGYDSTKKADLSVLSRFRDQSKISPNLRPYVALAVQTDLMQGDREKMFRPLDPITRAEAALLIYRAKLDETKVVFPVEPKPEEPSSDKITDNFSDADLDNWNLEKATGDWSVANGRVTADADDSDEEHFFLPLNWKEETKPANYELQADVIVKGTNGQGGLFFNGKDGKATVVYIDQDKLKVGQVTDPEDEEVKSITSAAYKLQTTNKLKIVVKGTSYSVYLNDKFVVGQQNQTIDGTSLGLYLQADAAKDSPQKATYFDNFSFKALP